MPAPKSIQSIGAHLLPRFSADPISNATDRGPKSAVEDRFILSSDDLNDPDKRALFTNEARQHLPWLHEQSELWEDDEHANIAFHASRELATSIDNWAKVAVDSAIVMGTLTDLAQDPATIGAMLPAMKAMAEAGNRAVYSLLITLAGQGSPDVLEQTRTFILANRLNIDNDRRYWMQQLELILAVHHFEHCEPVRVTSTMEMLQDPDVNPIPFSMVQDLVAKLDDLKGMEDTVHEALREAHEYFKYLYNDDADAAKKDRLKKILVALASTDSDKLKPLSDDDLGFLANDLTLPVQTLLMSIAYHAQVNPSYYETLEAFAERSKWDMPADKILQVLDGDF